MPRLTILIGIVCATNVIRPRIHHLSPLLKQVGTKIRTFDPLNRVSQSRLGDLPRRAAFGAPVTERASESMRHGLNPQLAQQLANRRVRQRLAGNRREQKPDRSEQFGSSAENLYCPSTQRDQVLSRCFLWEL